MATQLADDAFGTLASGIAAGDTTLAFTSGHGARFPAVTAPDVLYCCILNTANVLEEVIITAHTADADSCTITRAAGGTTAKAWNAGDRIEARVSKTALLSLNVASATTATSAGFAAAASTATVALSANAASTATAATTVLQTNDPAPGTYRLILGNNDTTPGPVYNFSALYFRSTDSMIAANISGTASNQSGGIVNHTALSRTITTVVGANGYTVTTADSEVVYLSNANFPITLPAASTSSGRVLRFTSGLVQALYATQPVWRPAAGGYSTGTMLCSTSATGSWSEIQSNGTAWIRTGGGLIQE